MRLFRETCSFHGDVVNFDQQKGREREREIAEIHENSGLTVRLMRFWFQRVAQVVRNKGEINANLIK